MANAWNVYAQMSENSISDRLLSIALIERLILLEMRVLSVRITIWLLGIPQNFVRRK